MRTCNAYWEMPQPEPTPQFASLYAACLSLYAYACIYMCMCVWVCLRGRFMWFLQQRMHNVCFNHIWNMPATRFVARRRRRRWTWSWTWTPLKIHSFAPPFRLLRRTKTKTKARSLLRLHRTRNSPRGRPLDAIRCVNLRGCGWNRVEIAYHCSSTSSSSPWSWL